MPWYSHLHVTLTLLCVKCHGAGTATLLATEATRKHPPALAAGESGACPGVGMQISYLHHKELVAPIVRRKIEKIAYYRIAAHYRFILRTFFDCFKYPRLIILEVLTSPPCA